MLRSMTGFGRGIIKSSLGSITCEIKTVNHRYLDIFIKSPRELQALDAKIKDRIKGTIHRGRVEIFIERRGGDHSISADVNLSLARTYLNNLQRLRRELNLRDIPSLSLLCQMPGVIDLRSSRISIERAWGETKKSVDKALGSLLIMREREGKFIEKDIRKRLKVIKKKKEEIEKRLPVLLNKYRKTLKTKLAELSGKINSAKASSEIAILSEKADVTEELSRFSSHLHQLDLFLKEKREAGKKINFTIQEMMREVNTIAAKTNDFPVARAVVFVKAELEKIKEQIQNVE